MPALNLFRNRLDRGDGAWFRSRARAWTSRHRARQGDVGGGSNDEPPGPDGEQGDLPYATGIDPVDAQEPLRGRAGPGAGSG